MRRGNAPRLDRFEIEALYYRYARSRVRSIGVHFNQFIERPDFYEELSLKRLSEWKDMPELILKTSRVDGRFNIHLQ